MIGWGAGIEDDGTGQSGDSGIFLMELINLVIPAYS